MTTEDRRLGLKGRIGIGVRAAFRVFYPDARGDTQIFADHVARALAPDATVLDAGCGSGAFFPYDWKNRVRLLVGCDYGPNVVQNQNLDAGLRADLGYLPFAGSTFDVIFSRYVVEHISQPSEVVHELARVLKPGGRLIIVTPSKYHYVALFSRLTPHAVHEIVSRLRGNRAHDAFPTTYLLNSRSDLEAHARDTGLCLTTYVAHEGPPRYLLWAFPAFLVGVLYERIVNHFEILAPFRVSIIATLTRHSVEEN